MTATLRPAAAVKHQLLQIYEEGTVIPLAQALDDMEMIRGLASLIRQARTVSADANIQAAFIIGKMKPHRKT
jgi:hypothetical protein